MKQLQNLPNFQTFNTQELQLEVMPEKLLKMFQRKLQ